MKGNSSFNNPSTKKPFKVDLNEYVSGQDYDGIKKFNLNNGFKDPTMLSEKLTLDFFERTSCNNATLLGTPELDAGMESISLYPNPAQDMARLVLPASTSISSLKVLEVNGREIQNLSFSQVSPNTYNLSTTEMANGIYFLVVSSGEKAPLTTKLVVMH